MGENKAKQALLVILAIISAIVILPVLGSVPLHPDERLLLSVANNFIDSGISSVFDMHGSDFPGNFYAYLVAITTNLSNISDEYAIRIPSALVIILLTLGMFQFKPQTDSISKAFLAALLFLSCYTVSALAYHANALSLMALFFIFSLSATYHWIKRPVKRQTYLLILATACSSILMGMLSPIITTLTGIVFIMMQTGKIQRSILKLLLISALGIALAYATIIFLTNDSLTAQNMLGMRQIIMPVGEGAEWNGKLTVFIGHLFFSIFPWSVPIIVALFWIAFNPSWLKNKFMALSLIRQFGVIVFIISIPSFLALSRLSLIMLLAAIYFNMPIISSFLLSQIHNHSITWRTTGGIFAALTALMAIFLILAWFGVNIPFADYTFDCKHGWSAWGIILIACMTISYYTLWRNQRTIRFNNRYLYNIVVIYLIAQLLYKAYINPFIVVA